MKSGFGSPNSRPGEHGHTSVFDFGFFHVLWVGEHVGEGSFDFVHFAEAHGVEDLAAEFGVEGGGEGGGGFGGGGGGEGGGGAEEGGEDGGLHGCFGFLFGDKFYLRAKGRRETG